MPWESAGEIASGLVDGNVVTNVKRLYGVILTAGVDDATVTLTWTNIASGNSVITIRCDSTSPSAVYTPPRPISIGGRDVTIATTGTAPTVQIEVDGYDAIV